MSGVSTQSQSRLQSPLVVGLVGGIGSGKSEVAQLLTEHGGTIISGDALGHQALHVPEIRAAIVARWGTQLLDEQGAIVRSRLAQIVFRDPQERTALEGLVHPWIKSAIRHELENARQNPANRVIVLDAAVMLEAGWTDGCDYLVFVDTPRELRLQRIAVQRGWTAKEVENREQAQLPLAEKARRADVCIQNSGSREELRRQVAALLANWEHARA